MLLSSLAARFGDMALPEVLIALTACERARATSRGRVAQAYLEPPGAAR